MDDEKVDYSDLEAHGQQSLLDVAPDWKKHWQGMPEFSQKNLMPWQSVTIHFRNLQDRQFFSKLIEQNITDLTKSLWFPKAEIEKKIDKRYRASTPLTPKYPIYVPTKGRWDSALTIKALDEIGVDYYAVIQPQELEHYKPVVKNGAILLLPEGLGGLVPARNWIKDHSIKLGAERHWQIDDNISGFCRLHDNQKIRVADGAIFRLAEDFADRYENIAIAGFNYRFFAKQKQLIPPFLFNTRIYSTSLVSNLIPHYWRGVYNDDTDICLRVLKDGFCTVQFNAFLSDKMTTMLVKGGNTPIYQGDGRKKMAESLKEQHPDVVTITQKWGRYQHHVNYEPFKKNKPILKKGVLNVLNNYNLELIKLGESDLAPVPQESASNEAVRHDAPSPSKIEENRAARESVDMQAIKRAWANIEHRIDEDHVKEHIQLLFPINPK